MKFYSKLAVIVDTSPNFSEILIKKKLEDLFCCFWVYFPNFQADVSQIEEVILHERIEHNLVM